jgi:transposase
VRAFQGKSDQTGNPWLQKLLGRRNLNIATVALANKNARIVWALFARGRDYESGYAPEKAGAAA